MNRHKEKFKINIFLYGLAVALTCLMLSACGSSADGADLSSSLGAFGPNGLPQDGFAGGPLSPVSGGNGDSTVFGPNGPGPGPGPGPNGVIGVIYATVNGGITSLAVAPDGSLSIQNRDLAPPRDTTRLYLNPAKTVLYATTSRGGTGNNFYSYSIDPATNPLTELGPPIDVGGNASDLAFLGNTVFAYVTNRNMVGFFSINTITSLVSGSDGQLSPNPNSPATSTGDSPNQLLIDSTGTWMYVINNAGSISIYRINPDGSLVPQTSLPGMVSGALPVDGTPFRMALSRDGRFLFVSLNGSLDAVATYALQSDGSLSLVGSTPVTGAGVLQEHPTLPLLYVTSDATLVTLDIASDGQTSLKPGTTPLPVGEYPGVILVDPSQNYLYVFNVFSSFISCFRIEPATGLLTPRPNFSGVNSISAAVILPGPDL